MTGITNFLIKIAGLTLFFAAAAFLSTCEKMPDYCSDHNPLNPATQFCFDGIAHPKCAGEVFNPLAQVCDTTTNTLWTICGTRPNVPLGASCYGYRLTATAVPETGGIVTPANESHHDANTPVSITANPASGYRFINWTVAEGTATFEDADNQSTTVTMSSDAVIHADFERIRYTLTIGQGSGTFTPASGLSHDANTPIPITATPASYFTFVNWEVTSGTATFENADSASTTVTLSSNATIRANFRNIATPGDTGIFTDSRDNRSYRKVKIGTQTWMAENLNYSGSGGDVGVCYDNHESNCDLYGRLYDWATVMGFPSTCNTTLCSTQVQSPHQGICPAGWHVPRDDEWGMLISFVGSSTTAGTVLKSAVGWNNTGNGTDDYGFSALPGGARGANGNFSAVNNSGGWWSATESGAGNARYRYMGWNYNGVNIATSNKAGSFSLRCLMDNETQGMDTKPMERIGRNAF
jgi:uncharacterized protein (TIGR02145 family)